MEANTTPSSEYVVWPEDGGGTWSADSRFVPQDPLPMCLNGPDFPSWNDGNGHPRSSEIPSYNALSPSMSTQQMGFPPQDSNRRDLAWPYGMPNTPAISSPLDLELDQLESPSKGARGSDIHWGEFPFGALQVDAVPTQVNQSWSVDVPLSNSLGLHVETSGGADFTASDHSFPLPCQPRAYEATQDHASATNSWREVVLELVHRATTGHLGQYFLVEPRQSRIGTKSRDFGSGGSHGQPQILSRPSKRRLEQSHYPDHTDPNPWAESDSDEEMAPKRSRACEKPERAKHRILACPYWKYDPSRYSEANPAEKTYRGCSSVYVTDIARLKQHLYRVHKMPEFHCQRCFQVFRSESTRNVHVQSAVACTARPNPFPEMFSQTQVNQLKKRPAGKTMGEAWNGVWRVLFPHLEAPQSPYANEILPPVYPGRWDELLRDFRQQAPSLLQQILVERMSGASEDGLAWLGSANAEILLSEASQELRRRLGHSNREYVPWHQSLTSPNTNTLPELPEDNNAPSFPVYTDHSSDPAVAPAQTGSGSWAGHVLVQRQPARHPTIGNRVGPPGLTLRKPDLVSPGKEDSFQPEGHAHGWVEDTAGDYGNGFY